MEFIIYRKFNKLGRVIIGYLNSIRPIKKSGRVKPTR